MSEPLRVAVLGAGAIARQAHLPMWGQREDAAVTVVADADPARAEQARADFDLPASTGIIEAVWKDPGVDAVDICTPPHTHAPLAVQAIAAGKHVLIEKPLAPTVAEAREIAAAARSTDRTVMVAENWVFSSAARTVESLIRDHHLGKPFLVKAWHQSDLYVRARRKTPEWSFDPRRSGGGYLLQAGVHTFALLHELVGELRRVQAWIRAPAGGVEDTAVVSGCFSDGGLASFAFTGVSAHPGERRLGFELFYTDAYISFDVWTGDVTASRGGHQVPVPQVAPSLGFDELAAHFVHCIRTGAPPRTAPARVLPALEAIAAAYASADADGSVVVIRSQR